MIKLNIIEKNINNPYCNIINIGNKKEDYIIFDNKIDIHKKIISIDNILFINIEPGILKRLYPQDHTSIKGDKAYVLFRASVISLNDDLSLDNKASTFIAEKLENSCFFYERMLFSEKNNSIFLKNIKKCFQGNIDLIITVGGIGFGKKDIVSDITRCICDKDLFNLLNKNLLKSFEKDDKFTAFRIYSGISNNTLIVNLPDNITFLKELFEDHSLLNSHFINILKEQIQII